MQPARRTPATPKNAGPARKKARPPAPLPAPPEATPGGLVYTIGFALALVSFVIGVYQTIVERDLASNYWLFMIALGFLFAVRWWRLRQAPPPGRR